MLSKLKSSAVIGIDAYLIEIEVDISYGMPAYIIVGLPDTAVKESRGRIEAAIKNSGFEFPFDRITINLAPANIKKEGSSFDLPIAVGILSSSGIIKNNALDQYCILGELSLDGRVKPVKGALSISCSLVQKGIKGIILPESNAKEAAIVEGVDVYPVCSLREVIEFLNGNSSITPLEIDSSQIFFESFKSDVDFLDVKGQYHVKRALEVAAAGAHNVIMIGPPGAGKSMLSKRIPTILPPMTIPEAVETLKIHSASRLLHKIESITTIRPFRSPHHTISDAGLIGGGQYPLPGEVSLAHNGVLFLDELAEFRRNVLEVMRQPLEDGCVTIARAAMTLSFPSKFMFVAACNPCPCGYLTHPTKECVCSSGQISKYKGKISGPLLDRIDIHIDVPALNINEINKEEEKETSAIIRDRVIEARGLQLRRFQKKEIFCNSQMGSREIKEFCSLCKESRNLLELAVKRMGISQRAYDRILRLSRTIADLSQSLYILPKHISEAIQYRTLDRD